MNRLSVQSAARLIGAYAIAMLVLMLLLGACTQTARTGAGLVTDKVLDAAIFTKCKAATIGAIDRRYMQTREGWELWHLECRGAGVLPLPMRDPGAPSG